MGKVSIRGFCERLSWADWDSHEKLNADQNITFDEKEPTPTKNSSVINISEIH